MENFQVYRDIQARTGGDIYIGVVGPVRTGKSTFIRRFMELVALPQMSDTKQAEIRDQLPLSGSGKIITTAETKFIPKEAVPITLGEDQQVKIRLIDSVGFLVKGASGQTEDGKERMVKTPWFEQAIPFREAARIGTQKVIQEHSTIGIVVTTDGSFGELPRDNFPEAEEKTIQELKKQQKPFIVDPGALLELAPPGVAVHLLIVCLLQHHRQDAGKHLCGLRIVCRPGQNIGGRVIVHGIGVLVGNAVEQPPTGRLGLALHHGVLVVLPVSHPEPQLVVHNALVQRGLSGLVFL